MAKSDHLFITDDNHRKKTAHFANKTIEDYESFAKFVREVFPRAKSVLDVGAGYGQSSLELEKQGFNVTMIDQVDYGVNNVLRECGITVLNNKFSTDTNIDSYDLIVGLHCCGATESIIRNCLENNTEFLVTLCELNPSINGIKMTNRRQYIDYLKGISSKLKETVAPIYQDRDDNAWKETLLYKKPFTK